VTAPAGYVVCVECGGRNQVGEDFCGDCGAYLAWEDAAADSPGPATGPADASASDGATADAPAASTAERPPAPPGAPPSSTPSPETWSVPPVPPLPPRPSPPTPPAETTLRQPTAPLAPAVRRRRPAAAPEEPPPAPDDVICPNCGAGNRPQRRFCRRCATPLTEAVAPAASSQPAAGARPKGRNTRFPLTALIVLLVILGALVVAWLNRDAVIAWVEGVVGFVFSSTGG